MCGIATSTSTIPLLNLPAEVLICIAEETSSATDLISLLQTCRYLHTLLATSVGRIHGSTALLRAARDNWPNQLEECLFRTGARYINTPTRARFHRQTRSPLASPVCIAAAYNNLDAVQTLLAAGADPNFRDRYGRTPFFLAVEYIEEWDFQIQDLRAVIELLISGADANIPGPRRRTPLMHAVMKGNPPLVRGLLVTGARLWEELGRVASIAELEDAPFAQPVEGQENELSEVEALVYADRDGDGEVRDPNNEKKIDL